MRCCKLFGSPAALLLVLVFAIAAGCSDDSTEPSNGSPNGQKIYYVDADATGSADGSSWANAFVHPQQAVDAASSGEHIWVAEGNYTSLSAAYDTVPVLTMKEGVEIYGGFEGDESAFLYRDPDIHITRLNGNGQANHVVLGADSGILDGFWIQGGNADGENYPYNVGGGMLNDSSSPIVLNCTFYGNSADRGGGAFNSSSSAVYENCTFTNNNATNTTSSAGGGGGLYNSYSFTSVDTCTFNSNLSNRHGGGIFNNNSSPSITACLFHQNRCDHLGGGMYSSSYGMSSRKPTVTNCTFESNRGEYGGGMHDFFCSSIIVSCIFKENQADYDGGGMYIETSYTKLTDCLFYSNQAGSDGGGLYSFDSDQGSSPVLKNCMIRGNSAAITGGGICSYDSAPQILDCTITGNSTGYGGGIRTWNSVATITDCIVWGNTASYDGLQLSFAGTTFPTVTYSDVDQEGYGLSPSGDADSNHNIRKDPLFVVGPGGNYYLSQIVSGQTSNSPCVDAGSTTAEILQMVNKTTRTDEGIDSGQVDMGYHYIPE